MPAVTWWSAAHAQIGGIDRTAYEQNNVVATRRLVEVVKKNPKTYIVHISSSVVESAASDWYTETKEAQEKLVVEAGIPCVVLRPTLMFGWFDRKHIGWLARFMQRVPIFPIPGHGRYLRQPLYAGDFCDIIMSCVCPSAERWLQHFRPGKDRLHRSHAHGPRCLRGASRRRAHSLSDVLGPAQALRTF